MKSCQFPIHPPEYVGGKEVIERLMQATNTRSNQALADAFGLSKSTVGTWRHRNLVPYEIVIRLHLETGISIRWLTLGQGEPYDGASEYTQVSKKNESKQIVDADCFRIENGQLVNQGTLALDKAFLNELDVINVMAIKDGQSTFLVNKESRQAVSGTYLVDMDGLLSLNEIQRLPGKKLAINFNGSPLKVEEDEVKVVGRVVLMMEKK
ncbi:transcriptional regulator [Vibrio vulnificus]|uniref:Phage repressor protein CI n=2 Tax=Vibrio TaxID=662 RepID=A0AA47JM80_VIBPH|nr:MULTISPECIES: phage repressor protein CI [Vibrio]MBE3699160.1 transcriptional regulator [Vibrio parahaemolyticus]MBE3779043.1 transcriptional regulator [Vibrio parahaemolyticus]MBE4418130.1 transcriptional regulator [Vibrio parahaemolyticus]MBE4475560.1 transcriptional regulator [Vibrio parahaemolyticus]MBN8083264.1 phage repressor protein CI [Vibrio vulnificus]